MTGFKVGDTVEIIENPKNPLNMFSLKVGMTGVVIAIEEPQYYTVEFDKFDKYVRWNATSNPEVACDCMPLIQFISRPYIPTWYQAPPINLGEEPKEESSKPKNNLAYVQIANAGITYQEKMSMLNEQLAAVIEQVKVLSKEVVRLKGEK